MKHELVVDSGEAGQRIDRFVGERLTLSRAKLKALFESDSVRLDERKVKKGDAVAAGQKVTVELEEVPQGVTADASLALTVLHEDAALVFVDKPSGVPSQPIKPGEVGTVANALLARYPEMEAVGDDPREAGLCHRLDIETSGVQVAARTREAWQALRKDFSGDGSALLDKRYLAMVSGPLADEGEIDVALVQAGDHVRPPVGNEVGRPAVSSFRVLARKGSTSLVEMRIHTGVMHQVRAHLAAVGAPIYGDERYGGRPLPGLTRFFLHAALLSVKHPVTGQALTVRSPLPQALAEAAARLGVEVGAAG